MTNTETIRSVYEAFGRADVAFILARVTDDTRWDFSVRPDEVSWHQPVEGKASLPGFFAAMGEALSFERFEPTAMIESGKDLAVRVQLSYVVRPTGKRVTMEQVHWWTFDDGGRIRGLRHFEDTAQVAEACAWT